MKKLTSLILCGYERGGTTLLGTILNSFNYYSGFEVGVLCCDSPSKFSNFQPYFNNMIYSWKISKEILNNATSGTFQHFYNVILSSSPFTKQPHKKLFYDKTPIYMKSLGLVLNRTNFINKAIVITRDPRSCFVSWSKRIKNEEISYDHFINTNIDLLSKRYIDYFIGCIAHKKNPNILFISFEDLCTNTENLLSNIARFINFEGTYVFNGIKPIFPNVEGNKINSKKIYEYKNYISSKTEELILNETKIAYSFFYLPEDKTKYSAVWNEKKDNIKYVFNKFDLPTDKFFFETINNTYFEPETYLLRYPDVLKAKVNPIHHFKNFGLKENRIAH